jgi:agmatine deiminase
MTTPRAEGFRMPAEWEPHAACWLAWPSHADLWGEALGPVREAFAKMCEALAAGPGGERLEVLVPDESSENLARARLGELPCRFHRVLFGDIWLRDTAPIFVRRAGEVAAVSFAFNGWGGKYVLEGDDRVAAAVAERAGVRGFRFPFVLEGGAVEVDGEGTCLTTRQCLQHPNRNPSLEEGALEEGLREALGVEKVLWVTRGLHHDHTDGHIDNLARFVAPGVVAVMEPRESDDPQADVLRDLLAEIAPLRDARGRRLEIVRIPSPGRVADPQGRTLPASYLNYYIGNRCVVVPVYGTRHDAEAVARIAALFPGRDTFALRANELLEGGGALHCISQQEPRP